MANDVATLNSLFRDDPRTIRYGGGENLYGHAAISSFRAARSPLGLARTLVEDGHHDLWAGRGRRFDAVSPRGLPRQGGPPDADLGPVCGRLAHRGGACEHDRRRRSRRAKAMTFAERARVVAATAPIVGRSRRTLADELRLALPGRPSARPGSGGWPAGSTSPTRPGHATRSSRSGSTGCSETAASTSSSPATSQTSSRAWRPRATAGRRSARRCRLCR